jgi:hypothetical protein
MYHLGGFRVPPFRCFVVSEEITAVGEDLGREIPLPAGIPRDGRQGIWVRFIFFTPQW